MSRASTTRRSRRSWIAAALATAAIPGAIVFVTPAGTAAADVCVGAGRRINVSGCANIADAIAPYVPPPTYYAPLPEDVPPPPVVADAAADGRRRRG
ncbi:hypothetical protein, partial [Mycobacterium sp. 852013-50091_SCH5140682]|uniref:hypothetical protein n=1 Tax=Mycobacterium sp. 852013-50091_SCH5140682 TaxID=1834109 RepID=UPI0009EF3F25